MKVLICINTCNRVSEVKKYIWDYLRFCNNNKEFSFVLAMDGKDSDYLSFCNDFKIPLIYSELREGVGLSKNRVLKYFPAFDYYFFIDDDIELIDSSIFIECIGILKSTGYAHLCGNHSKSILNKEFVNSWTITHSKTGGGYFTAYTGAGLNKVGGWHTNFVKYKRYGHTEHSYRFMHAGLQPAAFIFAESFRKMLLIHSPPSVIKHLNLEYDKNELILEERKLINNKTKYFPVKTLCDFYYNEYKLGFNETVHFFLQKNDLIYPLTKGFERRIALAEHFFLRINTSRSFYLKILFLFRSVYYYPFNSPLKHFIKTKILRYDR